MGEENFVGGADVVQDVPNLAESGGADGIGLRIELCSVAFGTEEVYLVCYDRDRVLQGSGEIVARR